jgi:hypothetical protein
MTSQDDIHVQQAYLRGKMDGLMKGHQCVQDTAAIMAVNPMAVVQHMICALIHEVCATRQQLEHIETRRRVNDNCYDAFHATCRDDGTSHCRDDGRSHCRDDGRSHCRDDGSGKKSPSYDAINAYREADKLKFQKQLLSQRDHEALYEDIDL